MNAIDFVKECDIDVAKRTLGNAVGFGCSGVDLFGGKYIFRTDDLKQIVEAFDCVMEHGSVEHAKKYAESDYTAHEVKEFLLKAISLVEQCQK